ncbi:metal ABC transporter permease [Rhizobium halophytocola]|uniref:Zinc/manganese transport system permease protein n=1 Tax=Rhizobium halophytocola TaxID=735519 RepID=A0ABS4DX80_9HYPH|nr:zinc/manganese transport system permease protein [Rhizobium halophytocola]
MLHDLIVSPFADYGFMRRALIACLCLSLGAAPIGCILTLRRMSLMGDALSHAVLPGAAIGYLLAGSLSVAAMGLGGLVAGLSVALLAGAVSRLTSQQEDASFACFYLASLALGVLIVSLKGSNIDLLHVLFGSVLAIDDEALYLVGGIASLTLMLLALIYRPLVAECFDPGYLRSIKVRGSVYHGLFLLMLVLNLVAGFQTLGTLLSIGLMILPASIAQLWARSLPGMMAIAAASAFAAGFSGLVVSYRLALASGPTIIVAAALLYAVSLLAAPSGLVRRLFPRPHLQN